ncbi:MAG: hypothetical protein HDR01_12800 [Lachnospiraceae bacterium]|nr:hypothetical protein [Lachnospiraceae bacterium]
MKKTVKFLVAMFMISIWYIIWDILPLIFCGGLFFYLGHPYEVPIITIYFMVMLLYCFHEITSGTWIGYLEYGFLLIICLVAGWIFYTENSWTDSLIFWDYSFLPIFFLVVLLSTFFYKRKQKYENKSKIAKINNCVFIVLFGMYFYLGIGAYGAIIYDFEIMMKVLPVFVVIYTIIMQKILKREYRWKLFFTYIVIFPIHLLKSCLLYMGEISLKGLLVPTILYGIAVAIGELITWFWDKRKDSRLAKQEAEDMESDWYL